MTSASQTEHPRPITARAAENGVYISAAICLLLLLLAVGSQVPAVGILFWIGAIGMPFFAFRLLSRNCMHSGGYLSFAEIWAEGIASFFLGSLIPAALSYVLLRFAFPDFIGHQVQAAIDVFNSLGSPEGDMWAKTLESLRERGQMPGAADIAANIISVNIVAGTVLSLFLAIVLSARIRMKRFRDRQNKS